MSMQYALTKYKIKNHNNSFQDYILCMALDESRNLKGVHLSETNEKAILNHIFVGRVEDVVPSINACFVRYAKDKKCFLPFNECENPFFVHKNSKKDGICVGDEILIQIVREPIKTKEAAATCNLSFHGQYMILETNKSQISISKKLSAEKKEEIKGLLSSEIDLLSSHRSFGVLVRTIAGNIDSDSLLNDFQNLADIYHSIESSYSHRILYDNVYEEQPQYISYLKGQLLSPDNTLITDDTDLYNEMLQYLPTLSDKIHLYNDTAVSLQTLYHMRGNMEELLSQKVWMKSGGNIIIEQLETLTFIDINSAKNEKAKQSRLEINKEATDLLLEQIELRNISGMIIVDYINMSDSDTKELISYLNERRKIYSNPCSFVDITKLGLVELTRKKVQRSIKEICTN